MDINEAIENLKKAKSMGHKSIVLAWWSANDFGMEDDSDWAYYAERIEDKMDWSDSHERMNYLIDLEKENEEEEE